MVEVISPLLHSIVQQTAVPWGSPGGPVFWIALLVSSLHPEQVVVSKYSRCKPFHGFSDWFLVIQYRLQMQTFFIKCILLVLNWMFQSILNTLIFVRNVTLAYAHHRCFVTHSQSYHGSNNQVLTWEKFLDSTSSVGLVKILPPVWSRLEIVSVQFQ